MEELLPQIERQYTAAVKRIEDKLDVFYSRYAEAAGMTLQQARQELNSKELTQYHMDVEEYIKLGEQNAEFFDEEIARRLELASISYRATRLEAMELELKAEAALFYSKTEPLFWDALAEIYTSQYSRTAFEIFKGVGIMTDFSMPNTREINLALLTPWRTDGLTFSDRLWGHCRNFEQDLADALIQGIMLGESYSQSAKTLAQLTKPAEFTNTLPPPDPKEAKKLARKVLREHQANCERLIMTEATFFSELAHTEVFEELGVEKYQYMTELAEHVCKICKPLDLKIFDLKKKMPGKNAPPMHPRCRCMTTPYINSENIPGFVPEQRSGRDEEGKSVLFPGNMTIYEWEAQHEKAKYKRPSKSERVKHRS